MAAQTGAIEAVCLMVPSGTWQISALVTALRGHHPGTAITAVWCGDPHLRPVLDPSLSVGWSDLALEEPCGAGWNRLLVALCEPAYEWVRVAAAVKRQLEQGIASVAVLRVGSVAVFGDASALIGDQPVTLVARTSGGLPADGLAPTEADVIRHGRFSTCIAGFRTGAEPALEWLARHAIDIGGESVGVGNAGGDGGESVGGVGRWLERMATLFTAGTCPDPAIVVAGWGPDSASSQVRATTMPIVLDLDSLDPDEPWRFSFAGRPARQRLSEQHGLAAAVNAGLAQRSGRATPVALPGGLRIDVSIRRLVAAALRTGDPRLFPPEPFSAHNSQFLRWLETPAPVWAADYGRYWRQLGADRADLQVAFPKPDGPDFDRFVEWTRASWRYPGGSVLLHPSADGFVEPLTSVGVDPSGLNVVGYHTHDLSLGLIAREIVAALHEVGVPVAAIDHHRTGSPAQLHPPSTTRQVPYATNLIVVNADQFEFLVADHSEALLAGRRTIGYWFWELQYVPAHMVQATASVDEIWVGSRFVADAFAAVTDKPVRHVPIPIDEPVPSHRSRTDFGLPSDRFIFVTTFDHFSVTERKNPFGSIEAFRAAFHDGEGPLLVIKTVNGDIRWSNHERLLLAAVGRSDIVVWDEHLSRPDQMAVLAAADCLVSLHRSEGLGLHCAEAMWLAKPVIATRYSGNLDFMDDSCAALIDYELVPVLHGEGVYPSEAMWADPDIGQTAQWMRRLVENPALATEFGGRARQRMQQQPSAVETGRLIARLAGIDPPKGQTSWD